MAKFNKKGKNLCAVDGWLETLGFYRKNVAYDETCLFRAVSEQLFNCQIYHERVRKECIAYARFHYEEFSYLMDSEQWEDRLYDLENHMLFCGLIELQVISSKYNRDIIMFDGIKQQVINVTNRGYSDILFLCLMEEDHYDVVYTKEHIVNAGFCQSIIYKVFYEKVFNIPKVDDIVRNMLYEKHNLITQCESTPISKENELANSGNMIAPFPFKVAKALDPNIYRNIEYDAWGDTRRELRLGEWYYGDDKLILGTRCMYNDVETRQSLECYIQEIKNQEKCVIYLTKTAQKLTVNYSDLSPEDDAKPWPLPYRFTKNVNVPNTPQLTHHDDRSQKNKKRNKEKKRTKSESSVILPLDNLTAYIGAPLHMQNQDTSHQRQEVSTEVVIQENVIPDEPVIQNHTPQWHYIPPSPDPFVWPPPPPVPPQFGYSLKPMIASAPVTPDVIPYHDPQYPYYFNYHIDPYHMYNQGWSNTQETLPSPEKSDDSNHDSEEQSVRIKSELNSEPVNSLATNKLKLVTNLTPQSPPGDVYSPVLQLPPGTPVIYTPLTVHDSEVLVQTPPVVYNPQMEISYIQPAPYIYPPTPPASWYPPGVNAQGFIFP